jgi:hypothetical protein
MGKASFMQQAPETTKSDAKTTVTGTANYSAKTLHSY